MTAEKAAREGNMRQLYDMTKKLSGNRRKPERSLKSKEGEVITNIEEQRNRWIEHFKELLNRSAPLNPPNIKAALTDLQIDVGPPTVDKISMVIGQIKSGKAAGPDNIPAEALKADVAVNASILHILFSKICNEEQVPTDWKEGLPIKIPKKGDRSKPVSGKDAYSNMENSNNITLDGETLEEVKSFIYLASIIDEGGGCDADVKARFGQPKTAFQQGKNI
ncbi:unnamed protein product [Schistosoma curassoni]|uniref:Reverse transcriptase domain-containing protein n=1 Tax=Schistosoma curassoni TaxID=6186 RepID=A0A183KB58_9TREM|nr:unnamed protein product [Schistosoma curassoni]